MEKQTHTPTATYRSFQLPGGRTAYQSVWWTAYGPRRFGKGFHTTPERAERVAEEELTAEMNNRERKALEKIRSHQPQPGDGDGRDTVEFLQRTAADALTFAVMGADHKTKMEIALNLIADGQANGNSDPDDMAAELTRVQSIAAKALNDKG